MDIFYQEKNWLQLLNAKSYILLKLNYFLAMTLEAENHENSSMDASKSGVEDAMAIDPKQGGTETSLPSTQLTVSKFMLC